MPTSNERSGLGGLLADVLAARSPSPELLARYADDPASLSAQERSELEALLAASPEVADQLRVMQSFDLNAALAEAESTEAQPVPSPARAPARRAPPRSSRWTRAWLPAAGIAAAAGFALAVLVMRPTPDPSQGQRVADLEAQLEQSRAQVAQLEHALRSAGGDEKRAAHVAALEGKVQALDGELDELRTREKEAQEALAETRRTADARAEKIARLEAKLGGGKRPEQIAQTPPRPVTPQKQEGIALTEPFVIASNADFVSPNPGDPSTRTVFRSSVPQGAPRVTAWVPAQPGWTLEAQPNLYVHLAEATSLPVELRVARGNEIIAERTLPSPTPGGVMPISLGDLGIRLETGETYQWVLAIRPDLADRGKDIVVGGGIRRVETPPTLARELEQASPAQRLEALERSGFWYDALDLISDWIQAHPSAENLRAHRRDLLSKAGIDPRA